MKYATDFIGWYNKKSRETLGISSVNAEHLYLAYHEGRGGYKRKSYLKKNSLRKIAKKVGRQVKTYQGQLASCEAKFKCRHFYQIWPICRQEQLGHQSVGAVWLVIKNDKEKTGYLQGFILTERDLISIIFASQECRAGVLRQDLLGIIA